MRSIEPITINEVRVIYGDEAVEEQFVKAAIATAQVLMARIPDELPDENYRVVWQYLAAHYLAISLPRLTSEAGGGISASYELPSLGEGLEATVYGAQALFIDTTNTLQRLTKQRIPITFKAVGLRSDR